MKTADYFSLSGTRKCSKNATALTTSEPRKADQSPSTTKPMPSRLTQIQEASQSTKVFMTSRNNPSVATIRPQERSFRIGLTKIFTKLSTTAMTVNASKAE